MLRTAFTAGVEAALEKFGATAAPATTGGVSLMRLRQAIQAGADAAFSKYAVFVEASQAAQRPPAPRLRAPTLGIAHQNIDRHYARRAPALAAQMHAAVDAMGAVHPPSALAQPVMVGKRPYPAPGALSLEMGQPTTSFGSAYYPETQKVTLDTLHPSVAAHEAGHHAQVGLVPDPVRSLHSDLPAETDATRRAFSATGLDPRLAVSTGTYAQGATPRNSRFLADAAYDAAARVHGTQLDALYAKANRAVFPPYKLPSTAHKQTRELIAQRFNQQLEPERQAVEAQLNAHRSSPAYTAFDAKEMQLLDERNRLRPVAFDDPRVLEHLSPGERADVARSEAFRKSLFDRMTTLRSEYDDQKRLLRNPVAHPELFEAMTPRELRVIDRYRRAMGNYLNQHLQPGAGVAANQYVDSLLRRAKGL